MILGLPDTHNVRAAICAKCLLRPATFGTTRSRRELRIRPDSFVCHDFGRGPLPQKRDFQGQYWRTQGTITRAGIGRPHMNRPLFANRGCPWG